MGGRPLKTCEGANKNFKMCSKKTSDHSNDSFDDSGIVHEEDEQRPAAVNEAAGSGDCGGAAGLHSGSRRVGRAGAPLAPRSGVSTALTASRGGEKTHVISQKIGKVGMSRINSANYLSVISTRDG